MRPRIDKRRQWKFGPFNIHLYRSPDALGSSMFPHPEGKYQLTWEIWENRLKKLCPIQFWFRHEFLGNWCDFDRNIYRPMRYWWIDNVKCRIWPHNVLKIRTLKRTYTDEREKLLHANFEILSQYMDNNPGNHIDGYDPAIDSLWIEHWKEAEYLYDWWQKRDAREEEHDKNLEDLDKVYGTKGKEWCDKYVAMENDFHKDVEDHLIRLIKIRLGMW